MAEAEADVGELFRLDVTDGSDEDDSVLTIGRRVELDITDRSDIDDSVLTTGRLEIDDSVRLHI